MWFGREREGRGGAGWPLDARRDVTLLASADEKGGRAWRGRQLRTRARARASARECNSEQVLGVGNGAMSEASGRRDETERAATRTRM